MVLAAGDLSSEQEEGRPKHKKRSINKMNWKAVFENPTRSRMFLEGVPILYRRGTASHVREIWRAADDEGTIQAWDMVRLFPGRPTLHTTTSLKHALALIGAEEDW